MVIYILNTIKTTPKAIITKGIHQKRGLWLVNFLAWYTYKGGIIIRITQPKSPPVKLKAT